MCSHPFQPTFEGRPCVWGRYCCTDQRYHADCSAVVAGAATPETGSQPDTSTAQPAAGSLTECTLFFENMCPDIAPICGVSFEGGAGCAESEPGHCSHSGKGAYRVPDGESATIQFSGDVDNLMVLLVHQGASTVGTLRFLGATGAEVGQPVLSNADCDGPVTPALQARVFDPPARGAMVTAAGGDVWIDTLWINAQ